MRADASEVAPRHTAVTRVVLLAQADIPLRDLLPALLPRGCAAIGVAIYMWDKNSGRTRGRGGLARRGAEETRCELTLQLLALEGATPMWPKFQHFAVDISCGLDTGRAPAARGTVCECGLVALRLATVYACAPRRARSGA